jgi:hypothetical protein
MNDYPLKVRWVFNQKCRSLKTWHVVGTHPWAGVYFYRDINAQRYLKNYASSFGGNIETPKPRRYGHHRISDSMG